MTLGLLRRVQKVPNKSLAYITSLVFSGINLSQFVDIIPYAPTVGAECPFVGIFACLHRTLVQDTLHIAQEVWP